AFAIAKVGPRGDLGRALLHLSVVLGLGATILVAVLSGLIGARAAGLLTALLVLVDLVQIGRGYVEPRPADFAPGTDRFAAVDGLLAQHPSDRFIPDAGGPFRLHNVGMTYGLEAAGGYDSVAVWRYLNLLFMINKGMPYPYRQLKNDLAAGEVRRFDSP